MMARSVFLSSVAGPSVATILVRLCMAAIIAQADTNRRRKKFNTNVFWRSSNVAMLAYWTDFEIKQC